VSFLKDWVGLNESERLEEIQQILTVYQSKKDKSHYIEAYRAEEASYWFPLLGRLDGLLHGGGLRVLDIGAAYGTLLLYSVLWGNSGYGIDMMEDYWTRELEEEYGIQWAKCNIEAEEIPWNEGFHVILLTEVLEHFNYNPIPVFQKLRRCMEKGGSLLLSTPWCRYFGRGRIAADLLQMPEYVPGCTFVDMECKYYSMDEIFLLAAVSEFTVKTIETYNGHIIAELVAV
jgi:2-polyprenyl-3-methyl-5-hydroxy-6-metoxy-1,4-benzoquinol methylase